MKGRQGLKAAMATTILLAGASGSTQADDGDAAVACPTAGRAIGDGALPVGAGGADFGAIPEACIGSDVSMRLRGSMLVAAAAPDFYGSIAAAGGVRVRGAFGQRWMFSLATDAVTYRFVQNAVVNASAVDFGPLTVGAARLLVASPAVALSLFSRVLVPVDTARAYSSSLGGELGLAVTTAGPRPGVGAQGGVSLATPVTPLAGQVHTALRTSAVAEGWVSGPRWAGTLGGFARFQPAPTLRRTSSVGMRAGTRLAFRSGAWLAAVVEVPLLGDDRTDLVAALFAGFTPSRGRWR